MFTYSVDGSHAFSRSGYAGWAFCFQDTNNTILYAEYGALHGDLHAKLAGLAHSVHRVQKEKIYSVQICVNYKAIVQVLDNRLHLMWRWRFHFWLDLIAPGQTDIGIKHSSCYPLPGYRFIK